MVAPKELTRYADLVERALIRYLQELVTATPVLREAMTYSTCGGGKRVRAALAMGACEAVGGRAEEALPAACAVELVHAFSLVHDDLPCMDDDDLRRGRPTCHRVYGEAVALLTGDALLVQGLLALLDRPAKIPAKRRLAMILTLLSALGITGMIGGQVLDMQAEHTKLDLPGLRAKDAAKTGALIRAAVRLGALAGRGDAEQMEALDRYAASLGLAFQIMDDLLDLTGDAATIGKTPGSDLRHEKATYPALLGFEHARGLAEEEIDRALAALACFGDSGSFLAELARYVIHRDS